MDLKAHARGALLGPVVIYRIRKSAEA